MTRDYHALDGALAYGPSGTARSLGVAAQPAQRLQAPRHVCDLQANYFFLPVVKRSS